MKNLNNLIYLTKRANQQPPAQPVKENENLPEPINYSEAFNYPKGGYTQGEFLEQNYQPTHTVDTEPVWDIDDKSRQVVPEKQPNLSLDRRLMDAAFNTADLSQPITLSNNPEDYYNKYVHTPATLEDKQAWYDKLVNWIKENPWTAGAGALGLGGLGYYLLSDDDEEEEEE